MRKWNKMLRGLLALMLVLSMVLALPAAAGFITPALAAETDAETPTEETPMDFVLVVDLSQSTFENDPSKLLLEACKVFVDTLAAQNARLSVIAFGGSKAGSVYQFASASDASKYYKQATEANGDAADIKTVLPLSEYENQDLKQDAKENLIEAANEIGDGFSTTVAALGAAVDLLESNGSAADSACVIMVSDGMEFSAASAGRANILYEYAPAAKQMKEHKWPAYYIHLDYNLHEGQQDKERNQLMYDICDNDGGGSVGVISCGNAFDVFGAFDQIKHDFYDLPGEWVEPEAVDMKTGKGVHTFTVEEMTAETDIKVYGAGVDKLVLKRNGEEFETIHKNIERNTLVATVEDKYHTVKMICPEPGEWTVEIHGNEDAIVQVANNSLREMNIEMVASASSSADVLTKNDSISVDACMEYNGIKNTDSEFYAKNPATLKVYSNRGTPTEFAMTGDSRGYHCDLDVGDVPAGEFEVQVELKSNIFRDKVKYSNTQTFVSENLNLEQLKTDYGTMTANINSTFDKINLEEVFRNPDGDKVEYGVRCTDRVTEFAATEDSGYLTIESGVVPGTYEMELTAKDKDMGEPLVCKLTLVVENRPIELVEFEKKYVLWSDKYGFQKGEVFSLNWNLDEYFADPDGLPLTYTVAGSDVAIATMSHDNNSLTFDSVEGQEGTMDLVVTATDGIETVSQEFKVKVESGKGIFWKENGWKMALAAGILFVIVMTIIILLKNKRVKGSWMVSMNGSELEYPIRIDRETTCGRKGKFLMKELMQELTWSFPNDPSALDAAINNHFAYGGANKIQMVGVIRSRGCVLKNVPNNENVKIYANGAVVKGKCNFKGGELQIDLTDSDTGTELQIIMQV